MATGAVTSDAILVPTSETVMHPNMRHTCDAACCEQALRSTGKMFPHSSDVGRQRPHDRSRVCAAATTFHHQEFFSIGAMRHLGAKALDCHVGAGRDINA